MLYVSHVLCDVVRAIEENIVGSVLICTILLWVPASLLIHFLVSVDTIVELLYNNENITNFILFRLTESCTNDS